MSSSRYVGRHGSPRRRLSLPSVGDSDLARTAAKSLAGVGVVLGSGAFVIAPSSALGAPDPGLLDSTRTISAADLLAERDSEPTTASRSAERPAPAVTAPPTDSTRGGRDEQSGTGELAVEAVAKPEPEPQPQPTEEQPAEPAGGSDSSTTDAATPTIEPSQPVQTGAYSAEAAALGLGPNARRVYSAVRTQFPDLTDIGGYRAGDPGDHGAGRAVDIMVTGARGDQVAAWLQQHAGELNITYVIWEQRIWNPGSSWESMEDRGSVTANHYDHVHVSVS